jgi:3alpha(or 20beta)-hydroxysteroid dehydrogenase
MLRLDGRTALITGAARGQGAAEARLFVEHGARVIVADLLEEEGRALCAELGGAAEFRKLDVADQASWHAMEEFLRAGYGRLDVLVNNAAIHRLTPLDADSLADFDRVYAVNQRGVFLGIQCASALMRQHGGSIVNIASASGVQARARYAAYTGSKYAVRGITKVAALELAPYNIRVNAVIPGWVDTPMIRHMLDSDAARQRIASIPLRRVGLPEEVARVVLFLASDASSYSTGGDFWCEGGLLTGPLD